MRWQGRRTSRNVEDRRGAGGRLLKIGAPAAIVVALLAWLLGGDPIQVLQLLAGGGGGTAAAPAGETGPPTDEQGQFAAVVLADTEDTWNQIFASRGEQYREPTLVLFSDRVSSACGLASAAVGPFYCPADGKVYIDLVFFAELDRRFGAPGDFAQAYVVAHEVGHHVQNLLGISSEVRSAQQGLGQARANDLSVRLELQADCLAGVWGHHADRGRGLLEPGDVEEGLAAAAAIGDDRMQRRSGGEVQPESWTHGSSAQRVEWFRRGLETGRLDACDTFSG